MTSAESMEAFVCIAAVPERVFDAIIDRRCHDAWMPGGAQPAATRHLCTGDVMVWRVGAADVRLRVLRIWYPHSLHLDVQAPGLAGIASLNLVADGAGTRLDCSLACPVLRDYPAAGSRPAGHTARLLWRALKDGMQALEILLRPESRRHLLPSGGN